MPNSDYIDIVRDKCDMDDVDIVSDASVLMNITSAIRTYQNIRPLTDSAIIRLNGVFSHMITEAVKWSKNNSEILTINVISLSPTENETDVRDIQQELKKDMYRLVYIDQQPYLRFASKFTGTYKINYTYFELELDAFDDIAKEGLLFLASGNVCLKLAAKYAKVFDKQMQYDEAAFKDKSNKYKELATEYNKLGMDLLNINEATRNQGNSVFANWPYLERRVRRVGI